jgi:peptidyl-prolyl cis-trans isomerase C
MNIFQPLRAAFIVAALVIASSATAQDAEDKVVATIDGNPVYASQLALAEAEMGSQFQRLPEDQRRAAVLSALIDIKLMAKQAEEAGVPETEDFKKKLQFLRDRTLHNEYFRTQVVEALTEDEVRARYEKEIAAMPAEQEIRARHILVDSEEQAKAIIAELDAGKDFVELAKEKSTGPSGEQGGDLGYFTRGRMVPEFEEAAFALEPGTYTKEPVKTEFGWHVIEVEDKRDAAPPTYEQVADQIQRLMMQEKYLALLQAAHESADVEVTDPELKKALETQEAAPETAPESTKD